MRFSRMDTGEAGPVGRGAPSQRSPSGGLEEAAKKGGWPCRTPMLWCLFPWGGRGVCGCVGVSLSLSLSLDGSLHGSLRASLLPSFPVFSRGQPLLCLPSLPTFSLSGHIHSSPRSSLWNFFLNPRTFSPLLSLSSEAPLARYPRRHLLRIIASVVTRTEQN